MSVKRKSSPIWDFFTPTSDEIAKCDLCKQCFSYKTSVSNLKRHMQRKHPTVSLERQQVLPPVPKSPEPGTSQPQPGLSTEVVSVYF